MFDQHLLSIILFAPFVGAVALLFVDGKKKGTGAKPLVLKLPAGKHVLRVVYKGDAHEDQVTLKSGTNPPWNWEFTGVEEDPPKEE